MHEFIGLQPNLNLAKKARYNGKREREREYVCAQKVISFFF